MKIEFTLYNFYFSSLSYLKKKVTIKYLALIFRVHLSLKMYFIEIISRIILDKFLFIIFIIYVDTNIHYIFPILAM